MFTIEFTISQERLGATVIERAEVRGGDLPVAQQVAARAFLAVKKRYPETHGYQIRDAFGQVVSRWPGPRPPSR
jgi:hypothetical protein